MTVDVTVVVVTYNSADAVDGLLGSIPAALGDLTAEVIVVDNGSTDQTVEVVRRRAGVRLVVSDNGGYSAGINKGVAAGRSDSSAVLVLNPDARLDPLCVAHLHECLGRPGVGIVAPLIRDDRGNRQNSLRREPTLGRALGLSRIRAPRWSEYVQEPEAYRVAHRVDWALGAILLVSRPCLEAVGAWDESFFLYSEETDFCLRAAEAGFATWFEPRAGAVHIGGLSGQTDQTHAMQIVNRVRLYARRHGAPASAAYFGLTVLSELSWAVRGHRQSRSSLRALLSPAARPAQLRASDHLIPR